MAANSTPQVEDLQDSLRSVRGFISVLGARMVDQSLALTDAAATSSPYQYQTVTPQGVAVEGSRAQVTDPSAVPGIHNQTLILIVAVAVAVLLLKHQ